MANLSKPPVNSTPSAKAFLLKIILWLPLAFLVWYLLAPAIIFLVAMLANILLPTFVPHAIQGVEQHFLMIDIVTQFSVPGEGADADRSGDLIFSVRAMKYGYGIPVLLAMILATPGKNGARIVKFAWGFLILLAVQTWGVSFDAMVIMLFKLGPEISGQLRTTPLIREFLALGYQLGYLILPAVTPIVIWFVQNQDFVQELAPGPADKKQET